MSKVKRFGDIKDGDIIWKEDRKNWKIIPIQVIKVKKTEKDSDCVRVYIPDETNFRVERDTYHYDLMNLWSDKERAIDDLNDRATRMEPYYISKIDELVSQYDDLLRWKRSLEI
jgi:hypothetical protein